MRPYKELHELPPLKLCVKTLVLRDSDKVKFDELNYEFIDFDKYPEVYTLLLYELKENGVFRRYFFECTKNLIKEYQNEDLIKIFNSLIAQLRKYYYSELAELDTVTEKVIVSISKDQ